MTNEKVIDRVKKLLALSTSSYQAEAENAILKAQELLLANGLSMADVSSGESTKTDKEVIHESVNKGTVCRWHEKLLAAVIAENFRCTAYFGTYDRTGQTFLKIMGLKEDVEVCKEVIEFTVRVADHMWLQYKRNNRIKGSLERRKGTFAVKNDYFRGFILGVKAKFAEQVQTKALILVKDPLVTQEERKLNLREGGKIRKSTAFNEDARAAGFRDGKNTDKHKYLS